MDRKLKKITMRILGKIEYFRILVLTNQCFVIL